MPTNIDLIQPGLPHIVIGPVISSANGIAPEDRCPSCGGLLSEPRQFGEKKWRHCYSCHFEYEVKDD